MSYFLLLPFFIQAIAISFDEYYFHLRRGLPRFERIGHPLDTLSFLVCLGFVLVVPFSFSSLKLYIIFALLSCLLVTKDEFVHTEHCEGAEHWLHALLFLNHPLLLASLALIWPLLTGSDLSPFWIALLPYRNLFEGFIYGQTLFVAIFLLYQIIFWNVIWKKDEPPIKA